MLSRDAEHLYWLARYIERAENTGRLINVNVEMMLDFPTDKSLGWEPILEAMNSKDDYLVNHKSFNESDVIHYLSREKTNLNSIASCLSFASYNSEFIKDDLPRSAVEELNNLFTGITIQIISDDSVFIRGSVREVITTLLISIFVVICTIKMSSLTE